VPDDGAPWGGGVDQQGDPEFGDIRIGGYNFGNSTLALTSQPPPLNNFSVAGDMMFNTGQSYHIGSTYDLFTVAMHEFGHALGLYESSVSSAVMYGYYTGIKYGLAPDDIAGIQSIYSANGPRTPDAYNSNGQSNGSESTAANISSLINTTSLTALVPNLDITTSSQKEYFTFTAPSNTGSTMEVQLQSAGLSLLSPDLTVYAADGATVLASASGIGQYGTTLTLSVPNVTPGEQFYVMAQGAYSNYNLQMDTGRYALGLSFNGSTPPTEPSPIVAIPNGNPLQYSGAEAYNTSTIEDGTASPVIHGITPDNGVSSVDGVTNNPRISVLGSAPPGDLVTVYCGGQKLGTTVTQLDGSWTYNNTADPLTNGSHVFTAQATDSTGNPTPMSYGYTVVIDMHVPAPPTVSGISPISGAGPDGPITDSSTPTISGWTEPFADVAVSVVSPRYSGDRSLPIGTTEADRAGFWSYTLDHPPLRHGNYSLTATAMDVAGTWSAQSSAFTFTVAANPSFPVVGDGDSSSTNLTIQVIIDLVMSDSSTMSSTGNTPGKTDQPT
ncbi:MAG: Ig-like domain-containing protein, partial [Isosphaeraceae bacterium]